MKPFYLRFYLIKAKKTRKMEIKTKVFRVKNRNNYLKNIAKISQNLMQIITAEILIIMSNRAL